MKIEQLGVLLSATDLANHLSCRHLSQLDLSVAQGLRRAPEYRDPHSVVLAQRGLEHERAYVESLRTRGLRVVELTQGEGDAPERTREAMIGGADAIVQAGLGEGRWRGRADVLLRVNGSPSELGDWRYEVVDCKLSQETKAETVLQLCLYTELVGRLQGAEPEHFHVIRPEVGFDPESYRVAAYGAYFRMVKQALEEFVSAGDAVTYPEPVGHCDVCRWWQVCDRRRREDDHLSFVAGASKLQRAELSAQGVSTLAALAKLPVPVPFAPARGSRDGYGRIREQARIQWEGRNEGSRKYELLALPVGLGLESLPEPAPGDLFLDLEGDPFVGAGGQEYLFGVAEVRAGDEIRYAHRWALTRSDERSAYEWFVDWATAQAREFPAMHIYHFGAYEPSHIKRLMLRYASREEEVDQLLRSERFVDLHNVVKQTLRASVEQYSLKDLEQFAGYERAIALPEASRAKHWLEHELELGRAPKPEESFAQTVRAYNEDDCRATWKLREWLETIRTAEIAKGRVIPRPEAKTGEASEKVAERQQRVQELFQALTQDLPADPLEYSAEQAARWLLAHALDWHWREAKVQLWEFYQMPELSEEEWTNHKAALTGLTFVERLPKQSKGQRVPVDRYRFARQECSIKSGSEAFLPDLTSFGTVDAVDWRNQTIDIRKKQATADVHPAAMFAQRRNDPKVLAAALLRLGDFVKEHGLAAEGPFLAACDLLLRNPPRLKNGEPLRTGEEDLVAQACRVGCALDSSVLAIQGPPGSGKTYTGAQMICALVREGRKVGITAVSHAAIRALLDKVAEEAQRAGLSAVRCGHKRDGEEDGDGAIRVLETNPAALQALQSGAVTVLGGTGYLWAREEFAEAIDVLFVDEAGQMSLANVLACAGAARNLVLLGDPQQLEQPQRGSHPEGSDISALAHLLGGNTTITDEQGLFLAETRRLHPDICAFTSELFYERRLRSLQGLEEQAIHGSELFDGAGLWFVPVEHEGNQSYSPEEVTAVAALVERLTITGVTCAEQTNGRITEHALTRGDILIVAPYNDQVNRLAEALPGCSVGTVDKFQGQEAAVVIYSMATSSAEDAPRGMDFLFDPHRFNVASSRAKIACVVVGSPLLLKPDCRTPHHMELANVLCRYAEMSQLVAPQRLFQVAAAGERN